ncbi:MAG: type II toxin-antitoxin system RelE/ParE family toxin [Anaerolineales bacterium]|nr:type II toxin-antitoxin system RelE/ParE family toxin [Anaerolineales bacterium]
MYHVDFTPNAEVELARLEATIAQRVFKKLRWLAENFESTTPEALTGKWQGVFKLRVGDYRVLYTFDRTKQKILVHFVRHRREVYKVK